MNRDFIVTPIAEPIDDDGRIQYPTAHKLAIQARQSTKKQALDNRESYEAQTKAHYRKALRIGWVDADIMMFIENKRKDGKFIDASGTKSIDQRPTLQEMIWYVKRDEVKAIMTRGVDRLFRHSEMIEPAQFAKICKEHGCIIITDRYTYDFNKHPYDTRLFLQEAQAGADYITKHIGMMLQYKQEKALRGEWNGRMVPVGFILDEDKLWYIIYEPHARVVRWVYRRYRELSGNFAALWKEVHRVMLTQGYLFPLFPDSAQVPRMAAGYNASGYTITERGLKDLLVNPAYIGWWLVHEVIDKGKGLYFNGAGKDVGKKVLRAKLIDNHPAIVDEADFWYAYGQLAEQPAQRSRYSKVGTIPSDALLEGMLASEKYPVYVYQNATQPDAAMYVICDPNAQPYNKTYGSINVAEIDCLFTDHLLAKLDAGKRLREEYSGELFDDGTRMEDQLDIQENVMAMRLAEIAQQQEIAATGVDEELVGYQEEAASLDRTLHYGAKALDGKTIEEYAERLARLHVTIERLEYKQKRAVAAQEALAKFNQRLADIPVIWHDMGLESQRRFVKLVTEKILLTRVAPNWMLLEIQWLWDDAPSDICYIWQRQGSGEEWSDAENAILRHMYSATDRATILAALPARSWSAIIYQASRLELSRPYQWSNSDVPKIVSVDDAAFMAHVGIPYEKGVRCWWTTASQTDKSSSCASSLMISLSKLNGCVP